MSRAWADFVAYAKQFLRTPTAVFFTLAFPVLLILVFGGIFASPGDVTVPLHVQDQDDTDLSRVLVEALEQTAVLELTTVPAETDLEAYIRERSPTATLRIPAGFEAQIQEALAGGGAGPTLVLFGDPSSSAFQAAQGAVSGAVTHLNFGLVGGQPVVGVTTETVGREVFTFLDWFLPGVMGIVILNALFFTTNLSAEYRERHYFKLLATTPLRKGEWLLARTLVILLLIFAAVLLMLLVGRLAFGTALLLTPSAVALVASGTVLFTALGMAIGRIVKDIESANAVANVVYFPMMFLSGTFFPIEVMPAFLQPAVRLLPLTFVNDGLRDTLLFGNEAGALLNLAIVAVLAVVVFAGAARAMSWRVE